MLGPFKSVIARFYCNSKSEFDCPSLSLSVCPSHLHENQWKLVLFTEETILPKEHNLGREGAPQKSLFWGPQLFFSAPAWTRDFINRQQSNSIIDNFFIELKLLYFNPGATFNFFPTAWRKKMWKLRTKNFNNLSVLFLAFAVYLHWVGTHAQVGVLTSEESK